MKCNICGTQVNDGASFCPSCGARLANEQNNFNQNSYNEGQQFNQNTYNSDQQSGQYTYGQNMQFNQNGYNSGGFQPGTPIQERNIVMCIILSIVTCGIYGIFWYISLVDDVNAASGEPNLTSGGMVFLLGLITCNIYTFYWMYKAGELINTAKYKRGIQTDSSAGILYLLLTFFGLGIVSYCLIQNELNKMAQM